MISWKWEFKLGEVIYQSKKKLGLIQEIEFTKHFQWINESGDGFSDRLSGGSDETVKVTNKKYICWVI